MDPLFRDAEEENPFDPEQTAPESGEARASTPRTPLQEKLLKGVGVIPKTEEEKDADLYTKLAGHTQNPEVVKGLDIYDEKQMGIYGRAAAAELGRDVSEIPESEFVEKGRELIFKLKEQDVADTNLGIQTGMIQEEQSGAVDAIKALGKGIGERPLMSAQGLSKMVYDVTGSEGFKAFSEEAADAVETWNQIVKVNPEFEESTTGQFLRAAGGLAADLLTIKLATPFAAAGLRAVGGAQAATKLGTAIEGLGGTSKLGQWVAAKGAKMATAEGANVAVNTAAALPIATVMGIGTEYTDSWEQGKADGLSDEDNTKAAWEYAIGAGSLEGISDVLAARFFKLAGFANKAKDPISFTASTGKAISNIIKASATEYATEGAQKMWQNLTGDRPLMKDVAQEAMIGGLLGGAVGTIGSARGILEDLAANEANKTREAMERAFKNLGLDPDGGTPVITPTRPVAPRPYVGTVEENFKPVGGNIDPDTAEQLLGAQTEGASFSIEGKPVQIKDGKFFFEDSSPVTIGDLETKGLDIKPAPLPELDSKRFETVIKKGTDEDVAAAMVQADIASKVDARYAPISKRLKQELTKRTFLGMHSELTGSSKAASAAASKFTSPDNKVDTVQAAQDFEATANENFNAGGATVFSRMEEGVRKSYMVNSIKDGVADIEGVGQLKVEDIIKTPGLDLKTAPPKQPKAAPVAPVESTIEGHEKVTNPRIVAEAERKAKVLNESKGSNARAFLQNMARSQDPIKRALAGMLLKSGKKLDGISIEIARMGIPPEGATMKDADGNDILDKDGKPIPLKYGAGDYTASTRGIRINLDARDGYSNPDGSHDVEATLLHEIAHDVFRTKIKEENLTKAELAALRDLKSVFVKFREKYKDAGLEFNNENALLNLEEFIAETLVNPEVQQLIDQMEPATAGTSESTLARFLHSILEFVMGRSINPNSQLAVAWNALNTLAETKAATKAKAAPKAQTAPKTAPKTEPKVGDKVTLYDIDGNAREATLAAVSGTGARRYKFDDGTATIVNKDGVDEWSDTPWSDRIGADWQLGKSFGKSNKKGKLQGQKVSDLSDAELEDYIEAGLEYLKEEGKKATPSQVTGTKADIQAALAELERRSTETKPKAQPKAKTAPKETKEQPSKTSLPLELRGAKPRYAYGSKQFTLEFASDVDRAAYIAAQGKPSKRDADYVKWAKAATGLTEAQIRAHGRKVKDTIKAMAATAEKGGTLTVSEQTVDTPPQSPAQDLFRRDMEGQAKFFQQKLAASEYETLADVPPDVYASWSAEWRQMNPRDGSATGGVAFSPAIRDSLLDIDQRYNDDDLTEREIIDEVDFLIGDAPEGYFPDALIEKVTEAKKSLAEQYTEWGGRDDLADVEDAVQSVFDFIEDIRTAQPLYSIGNTTPGKAKALGIADNLPAQHVLGTLPDKFAGISNAKQFAERMAQLLPAIRQDIKNGKFLNTGINEKPYEARLGRRLTEQEKTQMLSEMHEKQRTIQNGWVDYLETGGYSPEVQALILNTIVKEIATPTQDGKWKSVSLGGKADRLPDPASPELAARVAQMLTQPDHKQKKISQIIAEASKTAEEARRDTRETVATSTDDGGSISWVKFPSKANDPENFDKNVQDLASLAKTSEKFGKCSWCTGSGAAQGQLQSGDFWIGVDENGNARTAIRMEGREIAEIRGVLEGQNLEPKYASNVSQFTKEREMEGGEEFLNDAKIQGALQQFENGEITWEELKASVPDFNTPGSDLMTRATDPETTDAEVLWAILEYKTQGYRNKDLTLGPKFWEYAGNTYTAQNLGGYKSRTMRDVEALMAEHKDATPEILEKLSSSADNVVRVNVAENQNTPPSVLDTLSNDGDYQVVGVVARNKNTPPKTLGRLASYKSPRNGSLAATDETLVRAHVAGNPNTSGETLNQLSKSDNVAVLVAAAGNKNTPSEGQMRLAKSGGYYVSEALARASASTDVLRFLVETELGKQRRSGDLLMTLAGNPETPQDSLRELAETGDMDVMAEVAKNENAPGEVLIELSRADLPSGITENVVYNRNSPAEALSKLRWTHPEEVAAHPNTAPNVLASLHKSYTEGRGGMTRKVQQEIAANRNTPPEILAELTLASDNDQAAENAIKNPSTPLERIQGMAESPVNPLGSDSKKRKQLAKAELARRQVAEAAPMMSPAIPPVLDESATDAEISRLIQGNMFALDFQVPEEAQTRLPVNTASIEGRPGLNPVPTINIESMFGQQFLVTIADELATGTTNGVTRQGGPLHPWLQGNEGSGWAAAGEPQASAVMQRAKEVYNQDPDRYPEGIVPMLVVQMGPQGLVSNEDVAKTFVSILDRVPEAKLQATEQALLKEMESDKSVGAPERLAHVKKHGLKGAFQNITEVNLSHRGKFYNFLAFGKAGVPFNPKSNYKAPLAKMLLGDGVTTEDLHIESILEPSRDPAIPRGSERHIVAIVGIDGRPDAKVTKSNHPNYPISLPGKGIGVLERTVHLASVLPSAAAQVASKAAAFAPANEKRTKETTVPTTQDQAVSRAFGQGLSLEAFQGDTLGWNENPVLGAIRLAFPKSTVFTDKESFDEISKAPLSQKMAARGKLLGVTVGGHVYINPEHINDPEVALHEFGHLWLDYLENNEAKLLTRGMELTEGTKELRAAIETLGDNAMARKEALATLIGNRGATIADKAKRSEFRNWLAALFRAVRRGFGRLLGKTQAEIQEMTLEDFISGSLRHMLEGVPISRALEEYSNVRPQAMFAGTMAEGSPSWESWRAATAMIRDGKPQDEIRAVTGWVVGVDGKPRWEFSDSDSKLKEDGLRRLKDRDRSLTLKDILDHGVLYAAYPEIADIPVRWQKNPGGSFMTQAGKAVDITVSLDDATKSTLLHEVQHWIQHKEGFDSGSSISIEKTSNPEVKALKSQRRALDRDVKSTQLEFLQEMADTTVEMGNPDDSSRAKTVRRSKNISTLWDKWLKEMDLKYNEGRTQVALSKEVARLVEEDARLAKQIRDVARGSYRGNLGEREARSTEARMDMTQAMREVTPVSYSPAVPVKTLNGTTIKRHKNTVGKKVGNSLYVHRDYASEVVPQEALDRAPEGFAYNSVMYDLQTGTIRFDESPDFNTATEPKVGKYVTVTKDGKVTEGSSESIWHHKWLWVKDDYTGFDVNESRDWSRQWLAKVPEVAKGTQRTFQEQLDKYGVEKPTAPETNQMVEGLDNRILQVNSEGYSPGDTSIQRKDPSSVFDAASPIIQPTDNVLHAGAGEKNNPDRQALAELAANVTNYDPQHTDESDPSVLRNKDRDVVVSPFVLNVLDAQDRQVPIADMVLSLKPEGKAIVGVRGDRDVNRKAAKKPKWLKWGDGWLVPKGKRLTFQKGFTVQDLVDTLSPHFEAVEVVNNNQEAPVVVATGPKYETVNADAKIDLGKGRIPDAPMFSPAVPNRLEEAAFNIKSNLNGQDAYTRLLEMAKIPLLKFLRIFSRGNRPLSLQRAIEAGGAIKAAILHKSQTYMKNLHKAVEGAYGKTFAELDPEVRRMIQDAILTEAEPITQEQQDQISKVLRDGVVRFNREWLRENGNGARTVFDLPRSLKGAYNAALDARKESVAATMEETFRQQNIEAAIQRRQSALNALPEPVRDAVLQLTKDWEAMTKGLIRSGIVERGAKITVDGKNIYITQVLAIEGSRAFAERLKQDPETMERLMRWARDAATKSEQRRLNSRAFLEGGEAQRAGISEDTVRQAIEDFIDASVSDPNNSFQDVLVGKLGLDREFARTMPPFITEAFRPLNDASTSYAKIVSAMAEATSNAQMFSAIKEAGLKEGWIKGPKDDGLDGFVAVDTFEGVVPGLRAALGGFFVHPLFIKEMNKTFGRRRGDASGLSKGLLLLNGLTMAAATSLNPIQGGLRNFLGGPFMFVASGKWEVHNVLKGLKASFESFRKGGDPELQAEIIRIIELGVFDDNPTVNIYKEQLQKARSAEAKASILSKLMGANFGKFMDQAAYFYQIPDNAWKYAHFQVNKARIAKIYPNLTPTQVEEVAADWTKNETPSFSRMSAIGRTFRTPGVGLLVGPFIGFFSEMIRVSHANLYMAHTHIREGLKTGNSALATDGFRRLAGSALAASFPAALAMVLKELFDIDDEEEDAARSVLPPWDRNSQLLFWRDKNGRLQYFNISTINPYGTVVDPFIAGRETFQDDENQGLGALAKAIGVTSAGIVESYYSPQMGTKAVAEAALNTRDGRPIYNPEAPLHEKIGAITRHIVEPVLPGTLKKSVRLAGELMDDEGDVGSSAVNFFLGRSKPVDIEKSYGYKAYEITRRLKDASSLLSKPLRSGAGEEEVASSYAHANDAYYRIITEMARLHKGAQAMGIQESELVKLLDKAGVPLHARKAIRQGYVKPFRPGKTLVSELDPKAKATLSKLVASQEGRLVNY